MTGIVLVALGVIFVVVGLLIMTVWRGRCVKCNSLFTFTVYDQSDFPWTHVRTTCLSCGHKSVKLDEVKEVILRAKEALKKRDSRDRGSADSKS